MVRIMFKLLAPVLLAASTLLPGLSPRYYLLLPGAVSAMVAAGM